MVVGLNNIYQYLITVRPAHVRDDTELACHLMLDIMFVTCAKLLIHTRFNLHKLIGTIGLAHSGTFGSHSQTWIVRSTCILSAVVFVFQQHTRINNQISQTDRHHHHHREPTTHSHQQSDQSVQNSSSFFTVVLIIQRDVLDDDLGPYHHLSL